MKRRALVIFGAVALGLVVTGAATRGIWNPQGAVAQSPLPNAQPRAVPVEIATAAQADLPIRLDALGTVQPLASVAIKSRLETEIVGVHFEDGASVKEGDLLFTFDSRAIEAQIQQAEGVLARDKAQLEGFERDIRRFTELLSRNAGTKVSVENAQTQADMLRGTIQANESIVRNLRVQLSYNRIQAPISGRIGTASVKIGNFVRPADVAPLATIVQTKPVYVTFGLPQQNLPEVRTALLKGTSRAEALAPGEGEPSVGRLAMVDNSVDPTTGMITVRALMENGDETLWPGTLVRVSLTLRTERSVTVPSVAVQVGQSGSYVFVVADGAAQVRPVTVGRTLDGVSVIAQGLSGGEVVVTDGQLLLTNGVKVAPRQRKAGT